MNDLADKVIIVTGAAGGIGRETALVLARRGARVVLVDQDGDALADLRDTICAGGTAATTAVVDIRDEAAVAAMVEGAVAAHGRIDGAFNNAGIEQRHKLLHELTGAEWRHCLDVDLTGAFNCMKHEIIAMLKSGGGSIVNTASGLGAVAIPQAAEYIAAKHGVVGLSRAGAVDYARAGIRVNAVLPGVIETPMVARARNDPAFAAVFDALAERHPIGRLGRPQEIAEGVAWLLSDAASFVTGVSLPIDGGYLAV